jgi:hypothetical protein
VLDINSHQGKFGEDYVRVLASAAGLVVYKADIDRDGVDLILRWPDHAFPTIDVQVKSWSRPRKSAGSWRFDGLTEVQFNKLAGCNYLIPRYLFLVVVPDDPGQYSEISADGMLLRYQSFYLPMREEVPVETPSDTRRRAVHVPIGNILTVRSLLALMLPTPGQGDA